MSATEQALCLWLLINFTSHFSKTSIEHLEKIVWRENDLSFVSLQIDEIFRKLDFAGYLHSEKTSFVEQSLILKLYTFSATPTY